MFFWQNNAPCFVNSYPDGSGEGGLLFVFLMHHSTRKNEHAPKLARLVGVLRRHKLLFVKGKDAASKLSIVVYRHRSFRSGFVDTAPDTKCHRGRALANIANIPWCCHVMSLLCAVFPYACARDA